MKISVIVYLLIVFLIVAVIYFIWKRFKKPTTKEFFNATNTELNLTFLKPVDAYKIIEASDYFSYFNKINMKARACSNLTDCKMMYKKELMVIDLMEERSMVWLMESMLNLIDKVKPKFASAIKYIHIKFAKTSSRLEGDMPHTHKNVIFLPSYFWNKVWQNHQKYLTSRNESIIKDTVKQYGSTIIHELIHILQRQFQSEFDKFYEANWNFIKFDSLNEIDKIHNIVDRNRVNPDGLDIKWIWKNPYNSQRNEPIEYYIILATFRTDSPHFLTDVDNNIYLLEKTTDKENSYRVTNAYLLNEHEDFMSFFKIKDNNYHPNEIAAEYVSQYLLEILGISPKIDINTGYSNFINWLENLIAYF